MRASRISATSSVAVACSRAMSLSPVMAKARKTGRIEPSLSSPPRSFGRILAAMQKSPCACHVLCAWRMKSRTSRTVR